MPKVDPIRIHAAQAKAASQPYQKGPQEKTHKASLIPNYFLPSGKEKSPNISANLPQPISNKIVGTGYFSSEIASVSGYNNKIHFGKMTVFINTLKQKNDWPKNQKRWKGYQLFASSDFCDYTVRTLIARRGNDGAIYPPGSVVATAQVDAQSALYSINVNAPFQHNKIGTELVRFMTERDKNFFVYSGQGNNSSYRLTAEGFKLVEHCVKSGILDKTKIHGDCPESPQHLYAT